MKCSLSECNKEIIDSNDGKVCIRTYDNNINKCKEIIFDKKGFAQFHRSCYNLLITMKGYSRKKIKINNKIININKYEQKILRNSHQLAEYYDSYDDIRSKSLLLLDLLKTSNHNVVFSGAGVSTSANIGDFRGISGKWTREEADDNKMNEENDDDDDDDDIPYEDLRPTLTHEVLSLLCERELIQYIITQNCDGLHRLSQIPNNKISELHGCIFIEYCEKCGEQYERSFSVMEEDDRCLDDPTIKGPKYIEACSTCGNNHYTARKCKKCKYKLRDNIIHFGDLLPEDLLNRAKKNAKKAKVMLSLGSTMLVTPANSLVESSSGKLVIINRQETFLDDRAELRIFGNIDDVFKIILEELKVNDWTQRMNVRKKLYNKLRAN